MADAEAAHARLRDEGFPMRPLVRMSREIDTTSGSAQVRFTVARLQKGVMAEGRIQFLTHGDEAALWQERWLDHRNGATGLAALLVSAPDPAEAAARFSKVLDRASAQTAPGKFLIPLDRGAIEVLDETVATALIGVEVAPGVPALVGYRLTVADLPRILGVIAGAGIPTRTDDGRAIVPFPPTLGIGAWIFQQE